MKNKCLKVKEIIKLFNLKILNISSADITKEINEPAIQRHGLELSGFFASRKFAKNIIGWGTKEFKWFKSLKEKKAKETINKAISFNTPLIILSIGMKKEVIDWIVEECYKYKITVVKTKLHLSYVTSTIGLHLSNYFAETTNVHASLVIINGVGVMIIGKSGIGKSEAVLELVQKGHSFVSDDTIVIRRIGKQFIGSPSQITKGMLEARGIGIIDIPYIYGQKSTKKSTKIELVVELVSRDLLDKIDRLGDKKLKYKIMGFSIYKIQIPVHYGRSVSALVEAATNVYLAKKRGLNPIETIRKRRK